MSTPTSDQALSISLEPYCDSVIQTAESRNRSKYKIMVVDDLWLNIRGVCGHLRQAGYDRFVEVTEPAEALNTIYRELPDLVLLDLMMPEINGMEILRALRADERFAHLPVLILTASEDDKLKRDALEAGATDFLSKPPKIDDLNPRVRNALMLKDHRDALERRVMERTRELEVSRREVVRCLARAAEYRDDDTGNHVVRVGKYVGIIAREIGLDEDRVAALELASILHDVGKIGISDTILLKPGKFTDEEFDLMKTHCDIGRAICQPGAPDGRLGALESSIFDEIRSPLLDMAATIAHTHHEKWNGCGYPSGLVEDEIPLEGRITAVADVFDALSSERPYKQAFSIEKSFSILINDSGTHFDPELVEAFLAQKDQVANVYSTFC